MVSVFPGRFVTEPQKAPALTLSQTVKAVTGKRRGRRREQWRAEEGKGGPQCGREPRGRNKEPAEDNNEQSLNPTTALPKNLSTNKSQLKT